MESDLATISASSLSTLEWISSDPVDLIMFKCSLSSGGLESDLLLQWERLCFPNPCLDIHPYEKHGCPRWEKKSFPSTNRTTFGEHLNALVRICLKSALFQNMATTQFDACRKTRFKGLISFCSTGSYAFSETTAWDRGCGGGHIEQEVLDHFSYTFHW